MEKKELNPTLVYVLSVLGFICCCFAGIGFIPSGIAAIIAHNNLNKVQLEPEAYEMSKIKGMKTAKIVAIVVFVINILYLLRTIYVIYTVGWDEMMEQSQEMMEQWQQ